MPRRATNTCGSVNFVLTCRKVLPDIVIESGKDPIGKYVIRKPLSDLRVVGRAKKRRWAK